MTERRLLCRAGIRAISPLNDGQNAPLHLLECNGYKSNEPAEVDVDHDRNGRDALRHVMGGVSVGRERPVMEHGSPAGSILEPSDTAEEERPALRYSSPRSPAASAL